MVTSPDVRIEVWKQAIAEAVHFNDLLMRLRTLALPVAVTVTGAGALLGFSQRFTLSPVLWIIGLWSIAAFTVGVRVLVPRRINWVGEGPVSLTSMERWIWTTFPAIAVIAAAVATVGGLLTPHGQTGLNIPLSIPAVWGGVVLVLCLYLLDRFYYFGLLVGAVRFLEEIEPQLSITLTKSISNTVPMDHAQHVISVLYCVPASLAFSASMLPAALALWR